VRVPVGAALVLMLSATACSNERRATDRDDTPTSIARSNGEIDTPQSATTQIDPASCGRDAEGQVACLTSKFELESCAATQVLGSTFRGNETEGSHSHRTAYGLTSDCISELITAAKRRNFRENDKGELIVTPRTGYRETLIIGLQISAGGSVVEWERVQE